ncbi:MAG: glycosyltransferase [Coriobacteriia bacterium]
MITLEDYLPVVGNEVVATLHRKARRLYGKRVLHINSTYSGGGVAEMLQQLVPLMNDVGIEADWRILPGPLDFFTITKQFHNGLHGEPFEFTDAMRELYLRTNEQLSVYAKINSDLVVVHDPQPLALVSHYRKKQPWVWRCHVDLTDPDPALWDFLTPFILRYDMMIVSTEEYRQEDLWMQQMVITPAIDPLSLKNADMPAEQVDTVLAELNIPRDKPYILQVSRFDKWKDFPGVIKAFRMIREDYDCRLVMTGSSAVDDPEGRQVFDEIRSESADLVESGDAIILVDTSNVGVNALQRGAAVVMQKSTREGFGLTVAEAMWKGRPMVATRVGGIPLQIDDRVNGLLVPPNDDEAFAHAVLQFLKDPEFAEDAGTNAREKIRRDFLLTRLLSAYLDLLGELIG